MNEKDSIAKLFKLGRQIATIDKLGGRDSFFGMKAIFETILEEEHEKMTDKERENDYPFSGFKGMMCYGNIIHEKYTYMTMERTYKDYHFTIEEYKKLFEHYKNAGSPDCGVLAVFMLMWVNKNIKKGLLKWEGIDDKID